MPSSLIPERPLLISPTLAATIGLEEAVMLHVLSEMMQHLPISTQDNLRWLETDNKSLIDTMPFWNVQDIERIQQNLLEKGLIQLDSGGSLAGRFRLAINQAGEAKTTSPASQPAERPAQGKAPGPEQPSPVYNRPDAGRATRIPHDWRPDETLYQQCRQRNIPPSFVDDHVRDFVIYWQDRGKANYSWGHTFLTWINKQWQKERAYQGAKELDSNMSSDWEPSGEAISILVNADINEAFIEDCVPEFVLYWMERGIKVSTWNTRFIRHVRYQWEKYTIALEHDTTPKLVPEDYTPSNEVYEILGMANIDEGFARGLIPEFILYWRERKEVTTSWHTKFLQHVKFKWAHRDEGSDDFVERVTDRSWAN